MTERPRRHAAEIAAEIVKATRARWMARHELQDHVSLNGGQARIWVGELADNGILVSRVRAHRRQGEPVLEYTLSAMWGGALSDATAP